VSDVLEEVDESAKLAGQRRVLPSGWRGFDRALVRATEIVAALIGITFAALISLEVVSRFVFDFSVSFVNAAARMLLVWFFLLGAGIALRRGAHVGFTMAIDALRGWPRIAAIRAGQAMMMLFFVLLFWSGVVATVAAVPQTDPGLGISLGYGVAALPVGAALLIYHLVVLSWPGGADAHAPAGRDPL
jgi:TRAP-type C4-dicarboxylate transport system permease small subunit